MATPVPSSPVPPDAGESRRLFAIVLVVIAFIAVPLVVVAVGLSRVDLPWSDAAGRPEWVTLPQLRATTNDGTVVRARVALDVPSTVLKSAIQRNTQQVGLLLELSVAAQSRAQLGSAEGLRQLAQDMRGQLNQYLSVDAGDTGVRSVAIQDLLIKPQ